MSKDAPTSLERLVRDMFCDGFPAESVPWLEAELQPLWELELSRLPAPIVAVSREQFLAFVLSGDLTAGADYGRWTSNRFVLDLYEPDRSVGGPPATTASATAAAAVELPFGTEPHNIYLRHRGPAHERIAWSLGTAVEQIAAAVRRRLEERSPLPPDRQLYASPIEVYLRRSGFMLEYYLYTHVYALPREG